MCACRGTSGFAHVSCLAEQAKILVAEAEENNLGLKALNERANRWHTCSLCEQQYHGVVRCALGWACWKTYLGRPEGDQLWGFAMTQLGNGLFSGNHLEDALPVQEAQLAMYRRLDASEDAMLEVQSSLAVMYQALRRYAEALSLRRDIYSGRLKLYGEEDEHTLESAYNYATSLVSLKRFKQARSLLRKTMPVARRVLGDGNELVLRIRWAYGETLYRADCAATLDNLREAVTILEDTARTARRVLGAAHPLATTIGLDLRDARVVLRVREAPPGDA